MSHGTRAIDPSRLSPRDAAHLALFGVRAHRLRSGLSALGIAIGVATIVAVLGISRSSNAHLIDQLNALGTNLLTVTPSSLFGDSPTTLPETSPAMVARIPAVQSASAVGDVSAYVYRNDRIDSANTNAITVEAAQLNLLRTLQAHLAFGRFLDAATGRYPVVVLGTQTAQALGVDHAGLGEQVWLARRWFTVIGLLDPVPLAPELDRAALIGFPEAAAINRGQAQPAEIYVRVNPDNIDHVQSVLAAAADPAAPQDAGITRPSAALAARTAVKASYQRLVLALGAIALLVGGIGISNIMILGVIERRGEIGIRRALGATRRHIAIQFLSEAVLVSLLGGAGGLAIGAAATAGYAISQGWPVVMPATAPIASLAVSVVVGIAAGLYPALRAARLTPTEALRRG
jgi:putative ABC transport system permease protein